MNNSSIQNPAPATANTSITIDNNSGSNVLYINCQYVTNKVTDAGQISDAVGARPTGQNNGNGANSVNE